MWHALVHPELTRHARFLQFFCKCDALVAKNIYLADANPSWRVFWRYQRPVCFNNRTWVAAYALPRNLLALALGWPPNANGIQDSE
jgi:hypothetical protein